MPGMIAIRPVKDVAAIVGCTRRAVTHARQSGRLPARFFVRRHDRWHLRADCFDQCVEAMRDTYGHGSQALARPALENDYAEARARRMRYQAELARLQLERFEAELLPKDAVVRWYTETVQRISARVLQVPERLSHALVGLDAGSIEERLEDALRATLRGLRGEFEGIRTPAEHVHSSESVI